MLIGALVALSSLLAASVPARAQTFLDPLTMAMGPLGTATLPDGTEVQGEPRITIKGMGNIKKLTLKTATGEKVSLGAADVATFTLVPGGLAKAMGAMNAMSSIQEASHTDAGEVMNRAEAVYVSGLLPNGKPALLQLLNPGFDATIQVFPDPAGRETATVGFGGVPVAGGSAKAYLVRKVGQPSAVLVKRGAYDELWDSLFADCPALQRPAEPDFAAMAADVAAHARACGPTPPDTEPVASDAPLMAPEPAEPADSAPPVAAP